MNKYIKYIIVVSAVLLLNSCAVTTKKDIRSASFLPHKVELHQTMDDFELLGEVDVSVEYSKYLLFFSMVNTINGEPTSKSKNIIVFHGSSRLPISLDKHLNRAVYKAYKEYPNADFFMPTIISKEESKMFLGAKVKKEAKIQAYRLKIAKASE